MLNNQQEIRAQLEGARRELQAVQERVAMLEAQVVDTEAPLPLWPGQAASGSLTFDDLREGCQILDFDWRYLYLNDAAAAHGRRPKTELLGRTLLECYPGLEASALFATLDRCMTARTTAQIENEFIYADGSSAWFELRIQPVPQGIFVLSLDITARHRAEEQLLRLHRTLMVLSDINQAIVRIRHMPTLLQHACQVAVEKGKFRIAWVGLFDQERTALQPITHAVASAQDQENLAIIHQEATLVNGLLMTMTQHKAPVMLRTEAARQAGYGAAVAFPLVVAGTVRGALVLYVMAADFFDEAELRLLDGMAGDLSFALEVAEQDAQRQQAELAVRQYARRMEILHEIDIGIIEAQSITDLISSANKQIRQLIPCQRAGVALFEWEKNETVVYALDGPDGSAIRPGLRAPMVPTQWFADFNAQRVKIIHDLLSLSEPLPMYHDAIREGVRTFLHVLLVAEGRPLGIFNLAADTPGFFTPEHEEIAAQVGYQLAIALHQMRLTEALAHHTAMLEEHVAEIKSEQRFQRMADTAPAMLWVTDATGVPTFLSRAWYEFSGLAPGTALGHEWITSIHPAEREQVIKLFQDATEQQHALQVDYRIRRIDGEYRWVLSTARPNFAEDGLFVGHIGAVVDIHERKLAEQQLQLLHAAMNQHAAELESRVIARTAQLQAANARVEAICNNSPDAILLLKRDLSIQQANWAFDQLFACQPTEYLEQPLTAFVQPEDAILLAGMLDARPMDEQRRFVEIRARRRDKTMFHAEMSVRTISGAELVCIIRDMTNRKKVEEALHQALAKERELNELKSRFVSMASHEFRTPLAAILTLTETLSSYRTHMTEAQIDHRLLRIREQVGYLTEIMNDVLQLAQLQARRAEFNPTLLDLDTLCRNVIDEFQSRPSATHHFIYTCDPVIQEVSLDRKLMRQIISNLLSNAVKYSAKASLILIDLSYRQPYMVLTISDQGIGIPAKDLPHLFDPFHRAENVGTISGAGLGLTITKASVELHGGTIIVESQEKVGTTFTVRLPVVADEPAQATSH